MKNIVRMLFILCSFSILGLLVTYPVVGQSNMVLRGLNGTVFDLYSGLEIDYRNWDSIAAEDLLGDVGLRTGYSIGGLLDVGAVFSLSYGEIEGQSSLETNISILYGVMLLKQDAFSPVSLELSGTYGYSLVESAYYRDADLQKKGFGYDLKCSLHLDTAPGGRLGMRFGVFGGYRAYQYDIENVLPASEETRVFSVERDSQLSFGLIIAVLGKNRRGRGSFFSIEPEMDPSLDLKLTVHTGFLVESR